MGLNYFLFLCRHLFVSLLLHNVTYLHSHKPWIDTHCLTVWIYTVTQWVLELKIVCEQSTPFSNYRWEGWRSCYVNFCLFCFKTISRQTIRWVPVCTLIILLQVQKSILWNEYWCRMSQKMPIATPRQEFIDNHIHTSLFHSVVWLILGMQFEDKCQPFLCEWHY